MEEFNQRRMNILVIRPSTDCLSSGSTNARGDSTQFEQGAITYRELGTRTNRIARYLARAGVQPGARVGVYLERSPELIVILLAILKTGAAFIPIDPSSPSPYIAQVVEASDVCAIVTERAMESRIAGGKARVLFLEDDHKDIECESPEPFKAQAGADDVAYVMYTSGSTGRPKGVSITHRGVVRLVKEQTMPA